MKFHSPVTPHGTRKVLLLDRSGITVGDMRARVGGGFYLRGALTFPWPWKKES